MIVALAVALTLAAPPTRVPLVPPDAPTRTYVVQPGDSVWSIAAEMYGSGEAYPIIYQFNGFVERPPYLLTPGQTLKLPIIEQGPEAQITWLRHDVRAKPPRSLDWLSARAQMNLWRLYRVSTGDASAAKIVFEDASDLHLREEALLVIYGASATATSTGRADKREVRLEQGTLTGGLAKLDGDAQPLVITTPAADVEILGRLTQIQAEALTSMVSAYDGSARVTSQGTSVVVKQGQGTVVRKGRRPEAPRPLPAAPRWYGDGRPALAVALPGGPAASWEAAWQPVAAAASYRVEVASDAGFDKLLYDTEVGAGVTRLRLASLSVGTWVVRVSTRNADKLESVPGPSQVVTVMLASASRRFAVRDGVLEAVGLVELRAPDGVSVADGDGPAGPSVRLGAGPHRVVWRADQAATETALVVLGASATLTVDGADVVLDVRDSHGAPAILPGLVIESSAHGTLPTTRDGTRLVARLPSTSSPTRVRARWAGGVLDERELVPLDVPDDDGAPERPSVPDRPERGWARPLVGIAPADALGLDLGLRVADLDDGGDALDLVLRGELALGDLGLDAGLVFSDVLLTPEVSSAIGDLWLGARWHVPLGSVALAPYVALGLPLGPGHAPRVFVAEPGLQVALVVSSLVRFDVRAALLARAGGDQPTLGFDSLVALGLGPAALSWRARYEAGALDGTLGLGFAARFGTVRLGLSLGYAPENAGVSGCLTLDVGLGDK